MINSRLVYIAKKTGSVPRRIRVGEIWRRLISKHFLHRHEAKVRRVMVEAAQFGVSMPGGAEALVHTRETIEAAIISDAAHGVWATVDVDFQNAFPTLRYEAIDTAVGARVPELQPWSRWCQDHCGVVSCHLARSIEHAEEQNKAIVSHRCNAGASLQTSSQPP